VRAFLLLLSLAILIAVAAGGAWLILGDTPNEVSVPDLIGKNFDEAINELKTLGFEFEVITSFGPDTAVNTVIRTSPEAGDAVKPGRRIILYVVEGRPMVVVPGLVGSFFIEAENILRRAGLERGAEGLTVGRTTSVVSDSPAGLILAQSPEAGTETTSGGKVDIVIAVNKEGGAMPNLINLTLDAARDSLARLGYDVAGAEPYITTSWPMNTIRSQVPAPGTKLTPDAAIRVIYARPPDAPNAYPADGSQNGLTGPEEGGGQAEPAPAPEPPPDAPRGAPRGAPPAEE
jgi:serine/threonine-protein kinase